MRIYVYLHHGFGGRCRVETSGMVENVHPVPEAKYLTLRFRPMISGIRFHSVKTPGRARLYCVCSSDLSAVRPPDTCRESHAAASPRQLKPCAFAQTGWTVYKLELSCVALCAPFSHTRVFSPYHAIRRVAVINVTAVRPYSLPCWFSSVHHSTIRSPASLQRRPRGRRPPLRYASSPGNLITLACGTRPSPSSPKPILIFRSCANWPRTAPPPITIS